MMLKNAINLLESHPCYLAYEESEDYDDEFDDDSPIVTYLVNNNLIDLKIKKINIEMEEERTITETFGFIANSEIICHFLNSITMTVEDEGANGTIHLNLSGFISKITNFGKLKEFIIELPQNFHNRLILDYNGYSYKEGGMVGKLLNKMPNLEKLVIPSAPDQSFFNQASYKLKSLILRTGYDHQNFIKNLAHSNCFPNLEYLEYCDYSEDYIDDYEKDMTSIADYFKLFESTSFPRLKYIKILNSNLTNENITELKKMHLGLQLEKFLVDKLDYSADY